MTLGERVPNPTPDFTDKVQAAFLSQMSEIPNPICDGMLVICGAEYCDSLSGPAKQRVRPYPKAMLSST